MARSVRFAGPLLVCTDELQVDNEAKENDVVYAIVLQVPAAETTAGLFYCRNLAGPSNIIFSKPAQCLVALHDLSSV